MWRRTSGDTTSLEVCFIDFVTEDKNCSEVTGEASVCRLRALTKDLMVLKRMHCVVTMSEQQQDLAAFTSFSEVDISFVIM